MTMKDVHALLDEILVKIYFGLTAILNCLNISNISAIILNI